MKAMRNWITGAGMTLALAGGMASTTAQAALVDRGNGMIYDSVLNVTWLADANFAQTSNADADGLMTWADAKAWAADLVFGGFSDWRLPTTLQPDPSCSDQIDFGSVVVSNGLHCTGSEMGNLFYQSLGGSIAIDASTGLPLLTFSNPGLFTNIQQLYWSATVVAIPDFIDFAWVFYTDFGFQDIADQSFETFAWGVRDGDVFAVPEPASALLIALGLAGIGTLQRRRLAA